MYKTISCILAKHLKKPMLSFENAIYSPNREIHPDIPCAFNHAKEIARSSHELESILDWCKEACSQEWRWQLVDSSGERQLGRYIFYFNDERDFCTFILKWS
jgi:hypothetical protein